MCGICGYVNWKKRVVMAQILDTLLYGLEKVEYRGYDSAGLAVDETAETSSPEEVPLTVTVRSVGNINQLRKAVELAKDDGLLDPARTFTNHIGIAHTRWATHGGVTKANCHPHQSCDGSFTIVHNGIMTNFVEVKEELLALGYTFRSHTDTEVIAVLAQHLHSTLPAATDFPTLMAALTQRIKGAYAILVKSTCYPNELLGYRYGSPLIVGARVRRAGEDCDVQLDKIACVKDIRGDEEEEIFFVSDFNSCFGATRYAAYIEDGDIAHFRGGRLSFYHVEEDPTLQLVPVERPFSYLEGNVSTLSKGSYPTFMLKEVTEQAETCLSTLHDRVDYAERRVHLKELLPEHVERILQSRRIFFISCGTSYHSCLAVRPLMEELVMPVSIENASDFLDRQPRLDAADTCIFVSQSGETADVLFALRHCKEHNAFTIGFNNVHGSSVDRLTHCSLQLGCGAEVGVASTKAYTSQVMLLTVFALVLSAASPDSGVQRRRGEIIEALGRLSQDITDTIKKVADPIKKAARTLMCAPSIIILGRGFDFATALEAALKIKELSYVHTEGINSGELKHGPLALVDDMLHIVSFCSQDRFLEKSMNAIYQIEARGGRPIIITNQDNPSLDDGARVVIVIPKTVDCVQPILNVIPAQLLAYHMAVMRGNNVDCPRNLAKSVTVE